ncbi:MAG: inositol monophosphatase family protein [Vulcanimicrobiaceae bacterium]
MLKSLALRPAVWNDRSAILELALAMGGHEDLQAHVAPMRRLAALLRRSDVRVLVAECDEHVVGFAEVHRRTTTLGDCTEAWLGALAVGPELRGHGIGRALLAAVDDAARELGCTRIEVESSQWRGATHAFYRSSGYVERRPAARFRRTVKARGSAPLEVRFLDAAALAASAVAAALEDFERAEAVGLGADGLPTEAADAAAERAAVAALETLGVPIVSEESGAIGRGPQEGEPWIALDPLDGSRNFRAGYPPYALAIGLVQDGAALAGFVCELVSGRRWSAVSGCGARADGRRIGACRTPLVGLPSPVRGTAVGLPHAHEDFERVRISGSTATDLCRVADGSLGAFVALDRAVVHVHDLAGALAIVEEAGGAILDRARLTPRLVPDPRLTYDVVAAADRSLANELLEAEPNVREVAGRDRRDGR